MPVYYCVPGRAYVGSLPIEIEIASLESRPADALRMNPLLMISSSRRVSDPPGAAWVIAGTHAATRHEELAMTAGELLVQGGLPRRDG